MPGGELPRFHGQLVPRMALLRGTQDPQMDICARVLQEETTIDFLGSFLGLLLGEGVDGDWEAADNGDWDDLSCSDYSLTLNN